MSRCSTTPRMSALESVVVGAFHGRRGPGLWTRASTRTGRGRPVETAFANSGVRMTRAGPGRLGQEAGAWVRCGGHAATDERGSTSVTEPAGAGRAGGWRPATTAARLDVHLETHRGRSRRRPGPNGAWSSTCSPGPRGCAAECRALDGRRPAMGDADPPCPAPACREPARSRSSRRARDRGCARRAEGGRRGSPSVGGRSGPSRLRRHLEAGSRLVRTHRAGTIRDPLRTLARVMHY